MYERIVGGAPVGGVGDIGEGAGIQVAGELDTIPAPGDDAILDEHLVGADIDPAGLAVLNGETRQRDPVGVEAEGHA